MCPMTGRCVGIERQVPAATGAQGAFKNSITSSSERLWGVTDEGELGKQPKRNQTTTQLSRSSSQATGHTEKRPRRIGRHKRHRVCSGPPSSDGESYIYPTPGDKTSTPIKRAPQTSGRSLPSTLGKPAPTEWRVNPAHGPCRKSKTNLDIWDNRNVNLQSKICEQGYLPSIVFVGLVATIFLQQLAHTTVKNEPAD